MRIDELDEWQGVTPQLVTDWLLSNGWTQPNTGDLARWGNGAEVLLFDPDTFDQLPFWATTLARVHGLNAQAVLRMINPRLRKGMPSAEARKACASWLVRDAETGEVELYRTEGTSLYSASDYKSAGTLKTEAVPLRDFGDWVEFWPCDANGNKTRWPTDAEGKML